MKLPSSLSTQARKIKKICSQKTSYIFSKKAFLIFRKSTLKNFLYFLIFWEMEISSSNNKTLNIFSQKKALLIGETETPKKFLIFQETETIKNFLYFRKELSEFKN